MNVLKCVLVLNLVSYEFEEQILIFIQFKFVKVSKFLEIEFFDFESSANVSCS